MIKRRENLTVDFSSAADSYMLNMSKNASQVSMKLENASCPNCAYSFIPAQGGGGSTRQLGGSNPNLAQSLAVNAPQSKASEPSKTSSYKDSLPPSIAEGGDAEEDEMSGFIPNGEEAPPEQSSEYLASSGHFKDEGSRC
jgi:hypothetical protein